MKNDTKALLVGGILSSLVLVSADILGALRYEGYRYASQAISELSAIGAPSRPILVPLGLAHGLLVIAFGWGVWRYGLGPLSPITGNKFNRYLYDGDVQLRYPLRDGVTPYLFVGGGGITVQRDTVRNQSAFTKGAGKVGAGLS